MRNMKIVVLSGGSGNTAIVKGLLKWYPECELNILVNAYDDGKSTGICRHVVDTLGVSDIRKNHEKVLKILNPDSPYLRLYSSRLDFPNGKEREFVLHELDKVENGCPQIFYDAVDCFFDCERAGYYEYRDFNIMNVVYSGIWKMFGYDSGNMVICDIIGIPDCVVMNSYDNVFISAKTQKGEELKDEASIVSFANKHDYIKKICYSLKRSRHKINPLASKIVKEADLIIMSTGTFWSSLLPTIEYGRFYDELNESKAKKIWILNSEEDKDSYGVCPDKFLEIAEKVGLNTLQWDVIYNKDSAFNIKEGVGYSLGLENGKNNPELVARVIFKEYFGLYGSYDKVLVDFDGTIYGDGYPCAENLDFVSNDERVTIITGNTLAHIKEICGADFISNIKIWANENSDYLEYGSLVDSIISNEIHLPEEDLFMLYDFAGVPICDKYCLKYRPVLKNREKYCKKINDFIESKYRGCGLIAKCTGHTTIDILSKTNNKVQIYYMGEYYKYRTIYIGDEIYSGNDTGIASLCDQSVNVNNPTETSIIFRLLK